MKPWQSKSATPCKPSSRAPLSMRDQVKGIAFLLKQCPAFWRELGKRTPLVAQFQVENQEDESWFVQVDDEGGKASVGLHPSPSVTWVSDLEAMSAAFRGQILPGRVRILGDFEEMRSLFRAIAQTQLPGLT